MSSRGYNALFFTITSSLKHILAVESPSEPPPRIKERTVALYNAARLYVSYIQISNQLVVCYDQMIQPQKRRLIRRLLDNSIGRALELKAELVQLNNCDFQFLDDVLSASKMIPSDMDILIPRYFLEERTEEENEKDKIIKATLEHTSASDSDKEDQTQMSVAKAVHLIQIHERARQGKSHFCATREIRLKEEEEKRRFGKKKPKPTILPEVAAVHIQKVWRGYCARRVTALERDEEMRLLGMLHPHSLDDEKESALYKAKKVAEERREMQKKYDKEYVEALVTIKEDIENDVVPDMIEKLQDRIRDYFHKYKAENETFPTFPSVEEGGSCVFLTATPPEVESEDEMAGEEEEKSKKEEEKPKKPESVKSAKDEKGKDQKGKGGKEDEQAEEGFALKPSKYVPDIEESMQEYRRIWNLPKKEDTDIDPLEDELYNDEYDKKIIEEDLLKEYKLSVRLEVDKIMRAELTSLTNALEKDLGKKGKKAGKKGGKKGAKGKAGKGKGGKGKGKKEKDLTSDRTFESLVEELVEQKILRDYPKVSLSDFIGSYNYCGTRMKNYMEEKESEPCLGDIRRVVEEFCILPMGSNLIHSRGAFVKSILFAGPEGSGKKTLVNAICTEIGATLLDLTAENIAGKYPGKQGLSMLMHLISKMGKKLQPTVIYIADAEKTFMKKVPKTDTTDPKRLKKDLPKFMKGISADDRILICGTSRIPFDCDLKGLGACYQKIVYLPRPDYGCRRALWCEFIRRNKGIITEKLDISTLCKVSDGFTAAHIKSAVQKVMTTRRIAYQEKIPLVMTEFSTLLSSYIPIYEEEHEAYKAWLLKMPLGKKRTKMLKEEEEGEGQVDPKAKGKKKK